MNGPVEAKVKWATFGAYVGAAAITGALGAVSAHQEILSTLPDWATALLVPLIPAVSTFWAGWLAKHTPKIT